jgi:alpha-tubulin suppressor-like RCC1 family protein
MLIDPVFGDIISGGDEVYGNKIPGMIMSFGLNDNGQLGNGNDNSIIPRPSISSDLNTWYKIAASNGSSVGSTFAIKTDGTLWVSGYNNNYQFGNGTNINSNIFVKVNNANDWSLVSSGLKHTAAIKDDGTLWTWGDNQYGQLGDGTLVSKSSPIQVGSLTNWKSVHCGAFHTAAIKTDGTLWIWGLNAGGQLGNESVVNFSSPIQLGALTTWKQVTCGENITIGII